jgi:hypothetical protein
MGRPTHLAVTAAGATVLLVTLVPAVHGSPSPRRTPTAGGSLEFIVDPSPACIPDATFPGRCDFSFKWKLKVKSRRECRARDVKIFRLDPPANGANITTPNTNRRGTRAGSDTFEAAYPGFPLFVGQPLDASSDWGGERMSFQAVAPRFKTYVHNTAFRMVVCRRLRSSVEDLGVPMPPPPAAD